MRHGRALCVGCGRSLIHSTTLRMCLGVVACPLAKPGRSLTPAPHPSPAPPQPPPLSSPILRPRPRPTSPSQLCTTWRRLKALSLVERLILSVPGSSARAVLNMQNRRSDCVTVFGPYAPREDQLDIAEGVQIKRLDLLALNGAESAAKRIHPKNSRPARAPSSGSKNLHGALAQCTYLTVHFLLRRRGLGRTRTLPSFSSTGAAASRVWPLRRHFFAHRVVEAHTSSHRSIETGPRRSARGAGGGLKR